MEKEINKFELETSPFIRGGFSTNWIMIFVCIACLPSCIFGIYQFGFRAFLVLLVSVLSSVLFEFLFSFFVFKKNSIFDFSAVVTGLLIGMNMPSGIPLFIPILASLFAIVVAKEVFGGLGQNFVNPAIAGRIFVFFSFTSLMTGFACPRVFSNPKSYVIPHYQEQSQTAFDKLLNNNNIAIDAFSSASPLTFYSTAAKGGGTKLGNIDYLIVNDYPYSKTAEKISDGTGIKPYYTDAFLGNRIGCIGETSSLWILIGGIFLLVMGIISWHIPVCYLVFYALVEWIFGGLVNGGGFFSGDGIYSILTGGVMLCAFFMATDYVSSPLTGKGKVIYSLFLALFSFLFRRFSSLPEGVSIALLLCNIITPTIDKFTMPRRYGRGRK